MRIALAVSACLKGAWCLHMVRGRSGLHMPLFFFVPCAVLRGSHLCETLVMRTSHIRVHKG